MSLQIALPLGKKESVKNLVFTILTHEYPLKLIELTNFIRKRYGKQVTFQAVRKAVLELIEDEVLIRKENSFLVNKEWIKNSKEVIDSLYSQIYEEKQTPKKVDSIGEEMSVFTFNSLNEMMKFWEHIIDDWFKDFKKGDYQVNCWQGAHSWEGILHPDTEKEIMGQLKEKGIKSYSLCSSNTQLDKNISKFYNSLGVKFIINPSTSSFDKEYYVATYGDLVVQTRYPESLVKELETFFKKTKKLENLDLKELSDIVNKKIKIQLSVIKNLPMAKQINQSIMNNEF